MRSPRHRALAVGLAAVATLAMTAQGGQTYAQFSDFKTVRASAGAGVWAPDPPAACGPLGKYKGGVVYGTSGDDVLGSTAPPGGNQAQIIMGLGGDDEIRGGNSGDCLVGGPGNDVLIGGNGKDILLGGPGNDVLDGGNAPDDLEGEDDEDVCVGGRAPDRIVNCEVLDAMGTVTASLARAAEAQELTAEGGSSASEPAEGEPGDGPATAGDDKDSVEVDQRNEGELFGTKSTSTLQSSQDPQADDRTEPSTVEQSQTSNASTEEAQQPAPEPQTCGESPEDVVSSEMASDSENHGCETTP